MGYLFVVKDMIYPSITATYCNLLKAKGSIWFKLPMKKRVVSCLRIYTYARRDFSHTKGWIFGYKLHITYNKKARSTIDDRCNYY